MSSGAGQTTCRVLVGLAFVAATLGRVAVGLAVAEGEAVWGCSVAEGDAVRVTVAVGGMEVGVGVSVGGMEVGVVVALGVGVAVGAGLGVKVAVGEGTGVVTFGAVGTWVSANSGVWPVGALARASVSSVGGVVPPQAANRTVMQSSKQAKRRFTGAPLPSRNMSIESPTHGYYTKYASLCQRDFGHDSTSHTRA
jgi:hypothetical protein